MSSTPPTSHGSAGPAGSNGSVGSGGSRPSDLSATSPLPAAKTRTGAGPIGWVGPLLAVLVTLAGLVLLRDGIFAPAGATGWPGDQQSWVTSATTSLEGLTRAPWMVALGVVVVLVGLYLLGVALRRRTRKVLALSGVSGAYLLPVDVARRACSAAEDVDGVLSATATATRRRISVQATCTGGGKDAAQVRDRVSSAVQSSLSALASPPAVRVKTTSTRSSDASESDHRNNTRGDLA